MAKTPRKELKRYLRAAQEAIRDLRAEKRAMAEQYVERVAELRADNEELTMQNLTQARRFQDNDAALTAQVTAETERAEKQTRLAVERKEALDDVRAVIGTSGAFSAAKVADIRRILTTQSVAEAYDLPAKIVGKGKESVAEVRMVNAFDLKRGDRTIELEKGAEPREISCVHEMENVTQVCWSEGSPAYRNYRRGEQVNVVVEESTPLTAAGGWCAPSEQLYSLPMLVALGGPLKSYIEALSFAQSAMTDAADRYAAAAYHEQSLRYREILSTLLREIDEAREASEVSFPEVTVKRGGFQFSAPFGLDDDDEFDDDQRPTVGQGPMHSPVKITVTKIDMDKRLHEPLAAKATVEIERDGNAFQYTAPVGMGITHYLLGNAEGR